MFTIRAQQMAELSRDFTGRQVAASLSGKGFETGPGAATGEVLIKDRREKQSRILVDDHGRIAEYITPLGFRYRFAYDARNLLTGVTHPSGLRVEATYNDQGLLSSVTRNGNQRWDFEWDHGANLSLLRLPDQTEIRTDYFGPRKLSQRVDQLGHSVRVERSETGAVIGLTEATGARTRYEYGDWDQPDRIIRAGDGVEEIARDSAGRITGATVDGDPWFRTEYDETGRLTAIIYADGHFVRFAYNDAGLLTEARNPNSVVKLEYDDQNRLVQEEQDGQVVRYGYDGGGLLTTMTTPAGDEIRYAYDDDARLIGVEDWDGRAHTIRYEGSVLAIRHQFPNQVTTDTRLLPTGLPAEIRTMAARPSGAPLTLRYEYTATDQIGLCVDSEAGPRRYRYDAAGRVLSVESSHGSSREWFAYDGSGNRVEADGQKAQINALNQLTAQGTRRLVYDDRGNLIQESGPSGRTRHVYNGQNLLVRTDLPSGERVEYDYDAFGRRTAKRVGNRLVRYVWSRDRLLGESVQQGSESEQRDYLYLPEGHTPLSLRIDGITYQYHTDHKGTPRWLTGPEGEVVWSATVSALGGLIPRKQKIQQSLRFPGQYWDEETDLLYNRTRYYSPALGRYVSRDPLDVAGGINVYVYAGNDPVNGSDPLGLFDWGGAALFTAGIALGAVAIAVCLPAIALTAAGMAAAAVVVGGAALVAGSVAGLVTDIKTDGCQECESKAFWGAAKVGAEIGAGVALMVATAGTAAPGLLAATVGGGTAATTTVAGIAAANAIGAAAAAGAGAAVLMSSGGSGSGGDEGGGGGDRDKSVKERAQELKARNGGKNRVETPTRRVDLDGDPHYDKATGEEIETPHVNDRNPPHPEDSPGAGRDPGFSRNTRPATHEDLDDVQQHLEQQGK